MSLLEREEWRGGCVCAYERERERREEEERETAEQSSKEEEMSDRESTV